MVDWVAKVEISVGTRMVECIGGRYDVSGV